MNEGEFKIINNIFSHAWEENGNAQYLISQIEDSKQAYHEFFQFLFQTENGARPRTSEFITQLRNIIINALNNFAQPSNIIAFNGDGFKARLKMEDVKKLKNEMAPIISSGQTFTRLQFVDSALGAIVAECNVALEQTITVAATPLPVFLEATSYITLKTAINAATDINSSAIVQVRHFENRYEQLEKSFIEGLERAQAQLTSGEKAVDEMEGKISESEAAAKKLIEDTQQRNDDLAAAIRLNHERLGEMETRISTKDADIKAHASALREELKIEATRLLWKNRASRNALSFWLSVIVLIVAVGVPTLLAWAYKAEVLTFIDDIGRSIARSLPENANSIQTTLAMVSHLLIVTLPLAFFIWMLKLIVRFNQRALALYDDAAQRNTMMDTYFHLIEKGAAEPQDRALILTALFRPGPGQSNDMVEPPNFADLMDSMKFKPS